MLYHLHYYILHYVHYTIIITPYLVWYCNTSYYALYVYHIILILCWNVVSWCITSHHLTWYNIILYYTMLLSCVTIPLYPMITAFRPDQQQLQSLYHITISHNRKYWPDVMMSGVMIFTLYYIILCHMSCYHSVLWYHIISYYTML